MLHFLPYGFGFLWIVGFGTIFSISAGHWLGAWIGLEINLIGFVPILLYRGITVERESTIKYLVVQALGSRLFLFGRLIIFSSSQGWSLDEFSDVSWGLSHLLICLGLMIKLGVFPFYFWLPGVMSGLSWFSCMVLATWQKLAPIFLIGCLLEDSVKFRVMFVVILFRCISALVGGLGGLNQTQFRSLLAYSSVVHLGWMVYCARCHQGAMKLYLFIYILTSLVVFGVLLSVEINTFRRVKKLSGEKLGLSVVMSVILLSLAGLPPLLGFSSKWVAINCGVYSRSRLLVLGILILGSLIRLFYYLRLCYLFIFSLYDLVAEGSKKGRLFDFLWDWFENYKWLFLFIVVLTFLGGLPILWSGDYWLSFFYALILFYESQRYWNFVSFVCCMGRFSRNCP